MPFDVTQDLKTQLYDDYVKQLAPEQMQGAALSIGPNHPINWNVEPGGDGYTIAAADIAGGYIDIAGDWRSIFSLTIGDGTKARVFVLGSTGNDRGGRPYTLSSCDASLHGGNTRLMLVEGVSSNTGDGKLYIYEVLTMPVQYELLIPENVGAAPGALGELVEWGLPNWIKPEFDVTFSDYDLTTIEWLSRWKQARLPVRLYQLGEWTAVARIAHLPLVKPRPKELKVGFMLRGIRLYTMPYTHAYPLVTGIDGATKVPILSNPFLTNIADVTNWSNYSELYGNEVVL